MLYLKVAALVAGVGWAVTHPAPIREFVAAAIVALVRLGHAIVG